MTPPSDFDAASGLGPWSDPTPSPAALEARLGAAPTSTCVAVHRLSNGGTLMRNAAAQEAFGPPKDLDTDDAFCAMFAEPDEGRRILALVALGQVFQSEVLLSTRQGARWFDIDVHLSADPATGERNVQFHAFNLGTEKPASPAAPALILDHHDDPSAALNHALKHAGPDAA